MRGCIVLVLLVVTQFFFWLFKVAGIGDVKSWSWPTVLIPLWIWLGLMAILITQMAFAVFWPDRREGKPLDGTPEGSIAEFFRKRRAKKHAKDREKWGITK